MKNDVATKNSGTFINNMKLPVHRWYRYSAGFSAGWVAQEIESYKEKYGTPNIVDPFVGSGTVLIEADKLGCKSLGIESHSFVSRIAKAKLNWNADIVSFESFARDLLNRAKRFKGDVEQYPELIRKCFPDEILINLDRLKKAYEKLQDNSEESHLLWLVITSILRVCSPVGTAQWQYVLPNKSKAKSLDPFEAYQLKVNNFIEDMKELQRVTKKKSKANLVIGDAREKLKVPQNWGDLLITSPPYANNYDYADAVRLELCFWGEITSWSDLQTVIRPPLVRSCTQHVAKIKNETFDIIEDPLLLPIRDELHEVCAELDVVKESKGGKKPYHTMLATYFLDLSKIWCQLRGIMRKGSTVCFVVGDSAPYGVYAPVDEWLAKLALDAGFKDYNFEKIRDRNIKWKNRKHRVPLKEGRLWVKG